MKTKQSPLEQLQAMTEQVGKTRRGTPRTRRDPAKRAEKAYKAQLRTLVQQLQKEIEGEVIPVVKEEKAAYQVKDYTADAWADRIIEAIRRVARRFVGGELEEQYEKLAKQTVNRVQGEATEAFVKQVNEAVGVDITPMLDDSNMQDYLQAASHHNAQLIKSIPQKHLDRVEAAVLGGIRGGDAPSKISQRIRKATGITRRRAEEIARDQTAKITGEITERRQKQAGVSYFQWITSRDERVGDDHRRAARRDVGYGPGVYRWDKPPPEGVPGNSTRPNCRCTAKPVFEWELPNRSKA
jgi:SPP1 gp7 family putative phage head morphogenesis protein